MRGLSKPLLKARSLLHPNPSPVRRFPRTAHPRLPKDILCSVSARLPTRAPALVLLLGFACCAAGQAGSADSARQAGLAQQEAALRAAIAADEPSTSSAASKAQIDRQYSLAYVLFLEHKAADSLAAFTQAAALRTPGGEDLRTVALDYVLLDDFVDAEKWMMRSLEMRPENGEAWYDLGRIRYSRSRTANAVDAFEHALRLDPHSVKAENNLGLALEAEGKNAEAEAAYRQAILWQKEAPTRSEQPLLNLGILLLNLERTDEALPLLVEASELAPADPTINAKINEQLGRAYRKQGKLPEAEAALERAVALAPQTASIHYLLGQVYWKEEKKDAANAEFARVAALSKTQTEPAPARAP